MAADRDPIVLTLSSSHTEERVGVPPGRYRVIARRPQGTRLSRTVVVSPGAAVRVDLADGIGPSPNEFMQEETQRGVVAPATIGLNDGLGRVIGLPQRNLEVISEVRRQGSAPLSTVLELRAFARESLPPAPAKWDVGPMFLKVRVVPGIEAIGLIFPDGKGPIVMLPPMREPYDVTFLAEGTAAKAPERYLNPSAQRLPVALPGLPRPAQSDLLALLAEPVAENATRVWTQATHGRDVASALEMLSDKYVNPGAALLGAHFLLRFMPDQLPLAWVENLTREIPEAIDGPVIAAWARLSKPAPTPKDSGLEAQVVELLGEALKRPIAYFARARYLLARALEIDTTLLKPDTRKSRDALAPFIELAVAAGGLEAFWGVGPMSQNDTRWPPMKSRLIAKIRLEKNVFVADAITR